MTLAATKTDPQDIVVDEVFPCSPQKLWRVLTDGELIARWLMTPSGFEAVVGTQFTFKTTAGGEWDGVIHCRVLEVLPHERLVYAWNSGHESNVGYGARLETVVTWTLSEVEGGTRLRLVHSGFVLPNNQTAYQGMGDGWRKIVPRLGALATASHGQAWDALDSSLSKLEKMPPR
jgi:uncharacterized protein YndB with AHSA1/START domain